MGALSLQRNKQFFPRITTGLCVLISGSMVLSAETTIPNPIGKVARLFNPTLVELEERADILGRRLMSLAIQEQLNLRYGIGAKGVRLLPDDPDPSCTIDLGSEFPIEAIYLVPLQKESSGARALFPKRFSIEFSKVEDFSDKKILYKTGGGVFPDSGGMPVKFVGHESTARFVRLTVNQGHLRGASEIFGLSELVVISNGYPVSFAKKVSAVGALDASELWYPEAITDGRMPLGMWHGGIQTKIDQRGDFVASESDDQVVTWDLDFSEAKNLDLLILYPIEIVNILDAHVISEKFEVQVRENDSEPFRTVHEWKNPILGSDYETPLVVSLEGISASSIRIKGTEPGRIGNQRIFGFSEIEVWSEKENLTKGLPVTRTFDGQTIEVSSLTDGFSSERQLIPVGIWLNQLHERWQVEREIGAIQPLRSRMASESELNATWGLAMTLGLTFLIPVFIIERRRMISKNQVDELRKRIASDLHDDIGSNLGSISLIARTARKDLVRLHGPEEVKVDLDEVESIARESSLAMRDIVWLLERKQDSIGDLVSRMRETASRLLRELDYTIECESTKTAAKLSLDAKRHLFLFYKESIHNVLKHSKATKVSIKLWDQGDKLALEVVDNGQGLPADLSGDKETPRTVRKLDDRARVLKGALDIRSTAGKGTRILLTVKRSLLTAAPVTE